MRNAECGMAGPPSWRTKLAPLFRIPHSRGLSESYTAVDGLERQPPPAAADRARHAARPQTTGDHEREVGLDVAVHRAGAHLRRDVGRQVERDRAVHSVELEHVAPASAPQRRRDRAVHRRGLRVPRRRDMDAPVDRVRLDVAPEIRGVDRAIDRPTDEAHAGRHPYREVDHDVVVLRIHVAAFVRLAGVLSPAVTRIHRADGDPTLVRHDLDLHLVRVAAVRMLHRRHLDVPRSGDGADVAVHAFDLDRLARGNLALPVELTLGRRGAGERQGGRDDERRERGEAHDHSSSWCWSWSLFSLRSLYLASCPGRHSRMSHSNNSSSSRALPDPIVKLKRCLVLPVSCTGKQALKSPLNVETETETLDFSGIDTRRSPSWVEKR